MPIQRTNRQGKTYYLHQGTTKTGKPRYFFSPKKEGNLCDDVPQGFEIYENPRGLVFCRRAQPKRIHDLEVEVVKRGLQEHDKDDFTLVDVKGRDIIVYEGNQREIAAGYARFAEELGAPRARIADVNYDAYATYHEALKFELVDEEEREFIAWRWCFRGSIDDWILLSAGQPLPDLVAAYCPHIGDESFFDLM